MKRLLRHLTFASLAAVVLSTAGCGGCSDKKSEEAAVVETARADIDPCAGLSSDSAAEILGGEAETLTREASFEAGITCSFIDRNDPGRALGFSVQVLKSEESAEALLEAMIGALEVISKIEPVTGIGQAAYQAPDPAARRLLFREGRVLVDLVEPADPELQRRAAAKIVKGL
jgi:hypothetical protein